ncbi:hypothetical protein MYVA_4931 [Mycolicibacterium vaccae 95051]|nr:hypothetical protein MYVA_4931 [Mycolicibacterium vaccae 95051]
MSGRPVVDGGRRGSGGGVRHGVPSGFQEVSVITDQSFVITSRGYLITETEESRVERRNRVLNCTFRREPDAHLRVRFASASQRLA